MDKIYEYVKAYTSYKYKLLISNIIKKKVQYIYGKLYKDISTISNYYLILNAGSDNYCLDISAQDFDIEYCLRYKEMFRTNRTIGLFPEDVCNNKQHSKDFDLFKASSDILEYLDKRLENKYNLTLESCEIRQQMYSYTGQTYTQKVVLDKYHYMDQGCKENCFSDIVISKEAILYNIKYVDNIHKIYQEKEMSGKYTFSPFAMSQLINEIIIQFYANNIFKKISIFSVNDLKKKQFNALFNIMIIPFTSVIFDSDGEPCNMKYLIKDGKLVDIISNVLYSNIIEHNSVGNADLIERNNIMHQRIIFNAQKCDVYPDVDCYVERIQISYVYEGMIVGRALIRRDNITFCSLFNISIEKLFNTVQCCNPQMVWNNNVKCPSCILTI